ncbi:MAG: hypothetical protein KAH22_08080 [Thiotrichaceae bacterium]|nr:hypothetical protein [Thiotrichaceae bacterium]
MLDIRIHDKYQVEFKTHYRFDQKQKHSSHEMEIYMFVPKNLDVNTTTYPSYLFYRDIQTYLRFETPRIALQHVAKGKQNPYKKLYDSFKKLASRPTVRNIRKYENQLKMFCCVYRKAMSGHITFIAETSDHDDIDMLVDNFHQLTIDILEKVRALREIIVIPTIDEEMLDKYLLIDEYLSLVTDQYCYRLLETLKKRGLPKWDDYKCLLLQLVSSEIDYRQSKDYISEPKKNDNNENLIYRMSTLRSYTESILFLGVSSEPEGRLAQQMVFGFAAGLAMLWATSIAMYVQYRYGLFTMTFFITLVISYIFKDRIKEGVRDYLSSKLVRFFYDQKTQITSGVSKSNIGNTRENFNFTKSKSIDEDIKALRNRDQISQIRKYSVGEVILHYRKKVKIFPKRFEQVFKAFNIQGVTDITRLNVSRFTKKMDNPKRQLFTTDGENYCRTSARKVYNIDFIVRYSSTDEVTVKRFRLVMDRGGARRLEESPVPEELLVVP